MSRYSINEFLNTSSQKERGQGTFELESPHLLEVKLNGTIWTKVGAMIGYLGAVTFKREGLLEHGLGNLRMKPFLSMVTTCWQWRTRLSGKSS